jgi:hypothetical protein
MDKEQLIQIYHHTKGLCSDFPIPLSLKHTTKIHVPNIFREKSGNIIVEPTDTVSALLKYGHQKTAVLNMASSKRKGGGVENGSMTQERLNSRLLSD